LMNPEVTSDWRSLDHDLPRLSGAGARRWDRPSLQSNTSLSGRPELHGNRWRLRLFRGAERWTSSRYSPRLPTMFILCRRDRRSAQAVSETGCRADSAAADFKMQGPLALKPWTFANSAAFAA
jgi:hypothetical protein